MHCSVMHVSKLNMSTLSNSLYQLLVHADNDVSDTEMQ